LVASQNVCPFPKPEPVLDWRPFRKVKAGRRRSRKIDEKRGRFFI
jgi:hypothetical protein